MRCEAPGRMKALKPNATHLALALVLIGLRPAIAADPAVSPARHAAAMPKGAEHAAPAKRAKAPETHEAAPRRASDEARRHAPAA